MKTHLSALIVLTGIITILTASGLSTKNVYAADEFSSIREFTIVVKNSETDEEFQCPVSLVPPIIAKVSAGASAKAFRPNGLFVSQTSFYRNFDEYGDVASHDFQTWQTNFRHSARTGTRRTFIINPGSDQIFEAFFTFSTSPTFRTRDLSFRLEFEGLIGGDECQIVAAGADQDYNDLVLEVSVGPI